MFTSRILIFDSGCDDASCTSIQIPKVDGCNPIKGVSEDHAIHIVGYNLSEWMQTVDFVVANDVWGGGEKYSDYGKSVSPNNATNALHHDFTLDLRRTPFTNHNKGKEVKVYKDEIEL